MPWSRWSGNTAIRMTKLYTTLSRVGVIALVALAVMTPVLAKEPIPYELQGVGITENIQGQIPLSLKFKNELGQDVQLSNYFNKNKVIVLNLVYFNCPMLCNLVLTSVTDVLKQLPQLPPGKKYELISISIDPKDTPKSAQAYKAKYISQLGNPDAAQYWHFLTGEPDQISAIAKSVGFNYNYDPVTKEYAHAACTFFITSDGKLARYLYGASYTPFNMKMAITEATERKFTSSVEKLLLFCYNYDHTARGYVLFAIRLMKVGGLLTIIVLAATILLLSKKYKNTTRR